MFQKRAAKPRSKNGFSIDEIPLVRSDQKCDVFSERKAISERGFTLVEVVIASVIFSILAAGLFSSALQARKWAEASVRESVATAVATGFLEQLTATDFANIIDRIEDRSQPFGFVSRDGEPLTPAQSLRPMSASDWGETIEVPLINRVDKDGNEIDRKSVV
jgi:prepilin-type N-terminal cleavage/methylation domain-containing protein